MYAIRWVLSSSIISVILATVVAGLSLPRQQQQKHPFGYHIGKTKTSLELVDSVRISVSESLQKPSKILTACLEYEPLPGSSESDVAVLSMQLRKVGAASIWTSNLNAMRQFKEEQSTAMGNFPGPCPIIYNGHGWQEAITEGADAVVLLAEDFSMWKDQSDASDVQIIWSVSSVDQVKQLTAESDAPLSFLFDTADTKNDEDVLTDLFSNVPPKSITILPVDAMQTNNTELSLGRSLKSTHGCTSILVKNACVGDAEDVPYATFIVSGLKSKKSSTFDMTGLTGSTNGHFGGIASSGPQKWQRVAKEREEKILN